METNDRRERLARKASESTQIGLNQESDSDRFRNYNALINLGYLRSWRDAFLAAGEAALVTRRESGEVMVERDLLHAEIVILEPEGYGHGLPVAKAWAVLTPSGETQLNLVLKDNSHLGLAQALVQHF